MLVFFSCGVEGCPLFSFSANEVLSVAHVKFLVGENGGPLEPAQDRQMMSAAKESLHISMAFLLGSDREYRGNLRGELPGRRSMTQS